MSDHERDDTDIRYALADDLERMGLWPDEDDRCQPIGCDAGYHLPGCRYIEVDEFYDGHVDTP